MLNWFIELFDFMPSEDSTWSSRVDWLNNLITAISVVCIVGITIVMLYFAIKYRRKSDDQQSQAYITHNALIETVWTVIPTIVCIFMFFFGYNIYHEMRNPPAGSLEINVVGKKWAWDFFYPNGKKSTGELVVPVGEPVKLIMTSEDVIHSFFLPGMRVKEDVYNGNYSYLWFTPIKIGESRIFCTEYCGTGHSEMLGKVKVVSKAEFNDYVADKVELPPAELGKTLYENNCKVCHNTNSEKKVGPGFHGIFGAKHEIEDGSVVECDENYIRESIKNPSAKIVKGYPNAMTPFPNFSEKEVSSIIAYLKTLK